MNAPVSLDQFGDVLTDQDLARLLQRSPRTLINKRSLAKRRGVTPDLPAEIPCLHPVRYRKADVAHWLATGSRMRQRKAS